MPPDQVAKSIWQFSLEAKKSISGAIYNLAEKHLRKTPGSNFHSVWSLNTLDAR